jgi:hypothetical protein
MVLGWPPSKIVSGDPDFQPRWLPKRGDEILIEYAFLHNVISKHVKFYGIPF